jgi:hypothetical protein
MKILLENGTDYFLLEDSSGVILTETVTIVKTVRPRPVSRKKKLGGWAFHKR